MSDLQIVLVFIGALIIVAVLVVNWWQERRFHQQVENSFSPLQSDALLDDPKLDVANTLNALDDDDLDRFSFDSSLPPDTDLAMPDKVQQHDDQMPDEALMDAQPASRFFEPTHAQAQGDTLPEGMSIEDMSMDALQLADAISKGLAKKIASLDSEYQIDSDLDLNFDINPVQHDDVKATFDEEFSHANKIALDQNVMAGMAAEDHKIHDEPRQSVVPDAMLSEPKEPLLSLPAMLHAQMDLTAVLYLAAETPVSVLRGQLTGLLDGYDKPAFLHVLDANKQWSLLGDAAPDQQVSRVACSLQLADRAGAVSRHTLNRFQLAVETLGLDINAHVEWQSAGDALTTATALDTFCIEVDKTMGFHLVHGENGAFTGTKLRGLAESQGLTLASDGVFKFFDQVSGPLSKQQAQLSFVMFNRDDNPFSPEMLRASVVKGVTFQLDIPHVKQCTEAFSQMVQVARQMEIGLNALLVDDNNKVLGDIQIEKIRQQLKIIHVTMLARGIVPGSDSAHRLFS